MRSTRNGFDSCIAHDVVGISTTGELIANADAPRYAGYSAATLVGYALDGFPIYGPQSSAQLDACGGTSEGEGYRYHIRSVESFVLGCFAGTPAQFIR